jgi:hypothetical protein
MPTRRTIKQAKVGKNPLNASQQKEFNRFKSIQSEVRIDKRELTKFRTKTGSVMSDAPRSQRVTLDLRKEVAKGSKASGVAVKGKLVRRGKVKAAESVVRRGKTSAAKKVVGATIKRAGPAATAVGAAVSTVKSLQAQRKASGTKQGPGAATKRRKERRKK